MKKNLLAALSLLLLSSVNLSFAAIVKLDNCNLINSNTAGCMECFEENVNVYGCNPQQASCQKEGLTSMFDDLTNTGNTQRVQWIDGIGPGTIEEYELQTNADWMISDDPIYEMPSNFSPVYNANNGDRYTIYEPGATKRWTQMKTASYYRFDRVTGMIDKTKPVFRVDFVPKTQPVTSTNPTVLGSVESHRQCIFYNASFCGDGVIDNGSNATKNKGEQCDDGNMTSGDGCSNACQTETTSSCTSLTVSPVSATVTGGGTVTLTCAGSGTVTSYSIVVKKPDGTTLTTITNASGTATIPATPTGQYTAQCFINSQTTTPLACQKVITNNAPVPDPICDSLTGIPSTLETDESFTYTCHADRAKANTSFTISGITPEKNGTSNTGSYTNTHTFTTAGSYTISCKVDNGAQVPDCQKTVTVSVPKVPSITIDKRDANQDDLDTVVGNDTQTVARGSKAVFKIRVTNNGTEDLRNISLIDTIAPNCAGNVTLSSTPTKPATWSSFNLGGSGSHTDTLLQSGEWFEYTCEKGNTLSNYTNTARADAVGNTSGIEVNDSDTTPVILAPICDELTVAPLTVMVNTPISYVCSATNATSYIIKQGSNILGTQPAGTFTFSTADTYNIGCFINGESTTSLSCAKSVTITNPPVATIPSIFIDKDDSTPGTPDTDGNDTQRVQNNGTATFTIRVRNNGNEALKTVVIEDLLASDCARTSVQTAALYAAGATANFDVNESFNYECNKANVTKTTFTNDRNTATAKGVGVTSSTNVSDSDVTEVLLKQLNPGITIEKDDDDNADDEQEIDEGDTAKFSIKVTNDGDEALENVVITDDLSGDCEKDESETRDLITIIGNRDSLFDPGEIFTYTCQEKSVQNDTFPDEINTVCAKAKGVDTDENVDSCDDTSIITNKKDEESLMCLSIESSKGSFGGAPFRTTITCDAVDYDSCEIEVMLDGEVIDTYDACSQSITLSEKGNYSVACIVNDERTPDCEMEIEVAAMTDIPTGTKIFILAFLSLLLTALGIHLYKKRTS